MLTRITVLFSFILFMNSCSDSCKKGNTDEAKKDSIEKSVSNPPKPNMESENQITDSDSVNTTNVATEEDLNKDNETENNFTESDKKESPRSNKDKINAVNEEQSKDTTVNATSSYTPPAFLRTFNRSTYKPTAFSQRDNSANLDKRFYWWWLLRK